VGFKLGYKTGMKEQLFDALPKLVERAKQFLEALKLEVSIDIHDEEYCDPAVEFNNEGVGISITSEEGVIKYGAYTTEFNPGVRYYPDGSGEPPSEDYVELGKDSDTPDEPLIEAFKAIVERRIRQLQEYEADEEEAACWLRNVRKMFDNRFKLGYKTL